jgi:iron complex transport system permease protein
LGSRGGITRTEILLLAGIALNALSGAAMGFLIFIADDQQIRSLTFWSLGSLANVNWQVLGVLALASLGGGALLLRYAKPLNLLLLGEAEARHLGVDIQQLKRKLLVCSALLVGTAVAFTGMIGFVGLVVPHLLRLWRGPNHQWVLPGAALLGGILLVGADLVARILAPPQELPIGVLTAAIGVPFFLWLLFRFQKKGSF